MEKLAVDELIWIDIGYTPCCILYTTGWPDKGSIPRQAMPEYPAKKVGERPGKEYSLRVCKLGYGLAKFQGCPVVRTSLPNRQLRNGPSGVGSDALASLPNRQLRKALGNRPGRSSSSLTASR